VAAERYCTDQGGQLVDRIAAWNTNADPSQWLELAGRMRLCEFEMGQGDTTTRISVDLVTLYSEEPTLAGLAYLSKVPATLPNDGTNPAAYNCMEGLAGTSQFGNTPGSGGGWTDKTQPVFVVMSLCMFADGSAIDEWGITYYSDGTVRGADLATKMRYQPEGSLPAVFVATGDN
jgi:putative hemolysin